MSKFIVTYDGRNFFSFTTPIIKDARGGIDMRAMVKHIQEELGTDAKFQVA